MPQNSGLSQMPDSKSKDQNNQSMDKTKHNKRTMDHMTHILYLTAITGVLVLADKLLTLTPKVATIDSNATKNNTHYNDKQNVRIETINHP